MSISDATAINDKWRLALANYLVRLSEQIKALEIFSESHCAGVLSHEDREKLTNTFHQLSGSGGTYGFAEISDNARRLEQTVRNEQPIPCADLSREIAAFCRASKAAVLQGQTSMAERDAASEAATENADSLPLIVAVDDDPTIRQAINAIIGSEARLLFGVNTGEAEQLMRAHNPALVLLDDIMPNGLTGLKFLEKIKDDKTLSKIPVIMITASDGKDDILRGLAAGANDYITKPFDPEKLRQVIRGLLSRRQTRIVLKLENRRLAETLAERLRQLRCLVTISHEDISEDWTEIGLNGAIVVCDRPTLPPDMVERRAATHPTCRFLCLHDDGLAPQLAESPSIAVLRRTDDAETIIRHIGIILASQKRK